MSFETEPLQRVVRPAFFVFLDIKDDPLYAWTGAYGIEITGASDPAINGKTFLGVGSVSEIGELADERGGSPPTTLTLSGVDPADDAFKPLIADGRLWQGRRAIIWLSYTDAAGRPIYDPRRIKTGRLDNLRMSQDENSAVIAIDIEGFAAQSAQALNTRYSEQKEIDPNDTSQDYVHDLANKKPDIGATGQGGSGSGGGGSGGGVSSGGNTHTSLK